MQHLFLYTGSLFSMFNCDTYHNPQARTEMPISLKMAVHSPLSQGLCEER